MHSNPLLTYYAIRINKEFTQMDQEYHWYLMKKKKEKALSDFSSCTKRMLQPLDGNLKKDTFTLQEHFKSDSSIDSIRFVNKELYRYDLKMFNSFSTHSLEFVYTDDNIYPLLCYSLRRMVNRITFITCSKCEKVFRTNKAYPIKYCSNECRKNARMRDKELFNEKIKQCDYLRLANNVNQSYTNRMNQIKKHPSMNETFSIQAIEHLNELKKKYQLEVKGKKQQVKDEKLSEEDFIRWLRSHEYTATDVIYTWEQKALEEPYD